MKRWRIKFTDMQLEKIVRCYGLGISSTKIAKVLGVGYGVILRVLREQGVAIQEGSRQTPLDESVFETITPESAYWIGFLMADGCVYDRGDKKAKIVTLSSIDREQILKFKKFLGSSRRIYERMGGYSVSRPLYAFAVNSKKIFDDLSKFGIVPRKSKIAKAADCIKNNRDFWRGCVDGDGYVQADNQKKKRTCVGLCGSRALVNQFRAFCVLYCPDIRAVVAPMKSIFNFRTGGKFADKIMDVLYRDCVVALDRKYDRVSKLIRSKK